MKLLCFVSEIKLDSNGTGGCVIQLKPAENPPDMSHVYISLSFKKRVDYTIGQSLTLSIEEA